MNRLSPRRRWEPGAASDPLSACPACRAEHGDGEGCVCVGRCTAGRCRGGFRIVACTADGAAHLVGSTAALPFGERVPPGHGTIFATVGRAKHHIRWELDTRSYPHLSATLIDRDGLAIGGAVSRALAPGVWLWTWLGLLELERHNDAANETGEVTQVSAGAAAADAQASTLRIEIDQAGITAPAFPRETAWWRRYLPPWFVQERSWDMTELEWDLSGITVADDTGMVVIDAGSDERRARAILRYLHRGPVAFHMADPDSHIRLVRLPADTDPDKNATSS